MSQFLGGVIFGGILGSTVVGTLVWVGTTYKRDLACIRMIEQLPRGIKDWPPPGKLRP